MDKGKSKQGFHMYRTLLNTILIALQFA